MLKVFKAILPKDPVLPVPDKLKARVGIFIMYRIPRCPWYTDLAVCSAFVLKSVLYLIMFCICLKYKGFLCVPGR